MVKRNVRGVRIVRQLGAGLLSLVLSVAAYAQLAPGREVAVDLKGQKIVRAADGKEGRESAATAKPGDVIEYVATYTNRGKAAVKNVVATLPIPNDTEYVGASALPANAQAATTSGVYQAMPLKRKIKSKDGKEIEQDVPLAEYRTLRWQVGELAPGKEFVATARVRLSTAPVTAPAVAPAAPAAPAKK